MKIYILVLLLISSVSYAQHDISLCDGTLNQPQYCPIEDLKDISKCDGTLDQPLYCALRDKEIQDMSLCKGTLNDPLYCPLK